MRRGQGSLEFLMTYGWVLLVILVVMVVMWQWGLFSLGETVEPGSFGFWGLVVMQGNEFIMDETGNLDIAILNNVGANATLTFYNITSGGFSVDCGACAPEIIAPGETEIITVQDPGWGGDAGSFFEAHVVLRYTDERTADNLYQSSGRIWGNIEL